jgi:hypothetical protein
MREGGSIVDESTIIKPETLRLGDAARAQLDRIESGVITVPRRKVRKG